MVVDDAETAKSVTVAVKALATSQVGDKVFNRYGSKGVISQTFPMIRSRDWPVYQRF